MNLWESLYRTFIGLLLFVGVPFFSIGIIDFWKVSLWWEKTQAMIIDIQMNDVSDYDYTGIWLRCTSRKDHSLFRPFSDGYNYIFLASSNWQKYQFCSSKATSYFYWVKKGVKIPVKIYKSLIIPDNFWTIISYSIRHLLIFLSLALFVDITFSEIELYFFNKKDHVHQWMNL